MLEIVEAVHGSIGICRAAKDGIGRSTGFGMRPAPSGGGELLIGLCKLLCNPVDTADKRHDPELVPDPDPSVCSPVPAEGLSCDFGKLINLMIIVIRGILRQLRLRIVCMNPASCRNVCAGTGNDAAVLDDRLPCRDIRQCNLVPPRNILAKKNARRGHC